MTTKIFVNLPVKDIDRSVDFFTRLGFRFDPQFTDKKGTCMIVSEHIFVMFLAEDFFRTFTDKEVCNAMQSTEAILALSASSRREVDMIIEKAVLAGAISSGEAQNDGWMYGRGFQDLDGHLWEVMHMDMNVLNELEATDE